MSIASQKHKKRTKARETLQDIGDNPSDYLIIHYSCESFFNLPQGNTPRVTSIAVRYVKNGQTHSFSIHKIAELEKATMGEINQRYDHFEKQMLDEFFKFARKHSNHKWININMRNINFGFEAINHRYRVLKGNPVEINDNLKIDLAQIFVDLYGKSYIPHPRFESLYQKNHLTMTSYLNGAQEAEAFVNGDFVALHQSTLRKVDNMHQVISMALDNSLKTNRNILEFYGITPAGLFYAAKESWIIALILFLLGISSGAYINFNINSYLESKNHFPVTIDPIDPVDSLESKLIKKDHLRDSFNTQLDIQSRIIKAYENELEKVGIDASYYLFNDSTVILELISEAEEEEEEEE